MIPPVILRKKRHATSSESSTNPWSERFWKSTSTWIDRLVVFTALVLA